MDEKHLYEAVWDASPHNQNAAQARAVLELATSSRPALVARPASPGDAETCRLASLACLTADSADFAFWRNLAIKKAGAIGWAEAVGLLRISEAFSELASANDHFPNRPVTLDAVRPSMRAIELMETVKEFLNSSPSDFSLRPGSPTMARLRRQYPEKAAFLQLVAGDFLVAARLYEQAELEAGDDSRGVLRARVGRAAANYLGGIESQAATDETLEISELAQALGTEGADIAETSLENASRMQKRRRDLLPYERL
jgi:hypothetical protein